MEYHVKFTEPVVDQTDPTEPANNGGVSLLTFVPHRSPTANVNNHSVVTVMTYAGVKFLLPGDNEPPSWDELLEQRSFVEAIQNTHVLVAPHHGRRSGFHRPLFDYISPLLTVISDGRFVDTSATNRYSDVSSGFTVSNRQGGQALRKCVTTRNDGVIDITVNPRVNQIGTMTVVIN